MNSLFQNRTQKLDAVARVNALRQDAGNTLADACRAVGCSKQQYQRWSKGSGLGKRGVPSDPEKRTGRPPALDLTDDEHDALRWCAITQDSTKLAVETFLNNKHCRPETFEALAKYLDQEANTRYRVTWPLSVRRACKVSDEERAQYRGKKHTADILPVGFRRLIWVDECGREHALRPGDLYESDDMSVNQPFRYVETETGREELGRQTLLTQCVQSLNWLGASPLGRPKDAYRAEDIADHLLAVVETAGLPLFWRFERGAWENDFINGVSLDELGERFRGERWGALNELFGVVRAFDSRGKGGIEGSFNFLQSLLVIHSKGAADIGRVQGEFEAASRDVTRAGYLKNDEKRARVLEKFWSIEAAADGFANAMSDFAMRPKQRREWGPQMQVPLELWRDEHPGKRDLRPEDAWYFQPVKKLATVRQGQVTTKVPHYDLPFVFTVNGVPDAPVNFIPAGCRVLIAFHPGHPERGCRVVNAEVGSLNRGNWHFGELLVAAAPCDNLTMPPQIDLRPAAEKKASGLGVNKKRAGNAARTEFRGVRDTGRGGEAPKQSTARDGLGQIAASMASGGVGGSFAGQEQREHGTPNADRRTSKGKESKGDRTPTEVTEEEEAAAMAQLGMG